MIMDYTCCFKWNSKRMSLDANTLGRKPSKALQKCLPQKLDDCLPIRWCWKELNAVEMTEKPINRSLVTCDKPDLQPGPPAPGNQPGPNRPAAQPYHGLMESGGSGDHLCACTPSPHGAWCPRGSTSVAEFLEWPWWQTKAGITWNRKLAQQKRDGKDIFCHGFIDYESMRIIKQSTFSHVIIRLVWQKFAIWSFQPFEFDRRFKYEIYLFKMFKQSTLTTHLDTSWYVSILESFSKILSQTHPRLSAWKIVPKKLRRRKPYY